MRMGLLPSKAAAATPPVQELALGTDILIPNVYQDGGCLVVGDDAGSTAILAVPGDSQFMVSASSPVRYRACLMFPDAGASPNGGACLALPTDAPIAAGAQVDLCMPPQYSLVDFYVASGTSTVCVYRVKPKTVCAINSP
jgi:hypothetical protein